MQLSLSDYLKAVTLTISDIFAHEVWIRAEIRAISTKGGHYYLELAEKNDNGQIIASCRATLWKHHASVILDKFRQNTDHHLKAGISVLIKGAATFHAQYGFSININDIDPNYTLGELAAAYNAMLKRLDDEGLIGLNKALATPFDIRHVLVISPQNAAGLGDFRAEADRLSATGACHFHYYHATFQGNHAPSEIRSAITRSINQFDDAYGHLPDLLVIIRGGGAVGDLAYLNDYELAALIAEQPVPVWVGIGHERDKVLIDEVAHTRFDTPSKVIAAIERQLINITQDAKIFMQSIQNLSQKQLTHAKNSNHNAMQSTKSSATKLIFAAKKDSHHTMNQTKLIASHRLDKQKTHSQLLYKTLKNRAFYQIGYAKKQSEQKLHTHQAITYKLSHLKTHLKNLQSLIMIQHPAKTLAKGYALVHQNGRIVSSFTKIDAKKPVQIEFFDGKLNAMPQN